MREGDTDEMEQKSCAKKGRYVTYMSIIKYASQQLATE